MKKFGKYSIFAIETLIPLVYKEYIKEINSYKAAISGFIEKSKLQNNIENDYWINNDFEKLHSFLNTRLDLESKNSLIFIDTVEDAIDEIPMEILIKFCNIHSNNETSMYSNLKQTIMSKLVFEHKQY